LKFHDQIEINFALLPTLPSIGTINDNVLSPMIFLPWCKRP